MGIYVRVVSTQNMFLSFSAFRLSSTGGVRKTKRRVRDVKQKKMKTDQRLMQMKRTMLTPRQYRPRMGYRKRKNFTGQSRADFREAILLFMVKVNPKDRKTVCCLMRSNSRSKKSSNPRKRRNQNRFTDQNLYQNWIQWPEDCQGVIRLFVCGAQSRI